MIENSATQIGRLRIRSASPSDPAQRLAISAQLSGAELKPPTMPPSAVLVIRSLVDPLPRQLSTRAAIPRPSSLWERAVQSRLDGYYRHAVRPEQGCISANAEAVLFQDESEMLACLALDLSSGRHLQRWWWRVLLQRLGFVTGNRLAALLREQTRQLPAILARLTAWRQATPVIVALTPGDILLVLAALLQEHDLNTLPLPATTSTAVAAESVLPVSGNQRLNRKIPAAARPPPWRSWLPGELAQMLSREQEYLLGIGLALYYAPASASSALFAAQVAGWWQDSSAGGGAEMKSSFPVAITSQDFLRDVAEPTSEQSIQTVTAIERQPPPTEREAMTPQTGLRRRARSQAWPSAADEPPMPSAPVSDEPILKHPPTSTRRRVSADQENTPLMPAPNNDFRQKMEISPAQRADLPISVDGITASALSEGVRTRLGGVLYLINVLESQDLSDSFEANWGLSSQLGGWGLLDSLARALLGDALAIYADDPIWRALAELDAREPGVLPQPQSVRWLAAALPYIRNRLSQALPPEAMEDCEFLKVPGWLYVSAVHVDLVAALDAISLPVRIAGLDHNPGWVAKLGRVVLFHFQ